ncbi:MAG TPA: hypothetical protein VM616_06140 [Gammaproteobacteria bacterium]|nr:hypothetical protein [Gammaproteobacteria bacterium]
MGDESESDAYEDDDIDDIVEDPEVLDIDHLIDDLESRARLRNRRDEPAWRRLEKYLEEKRCREDIADFEDFELE